MFTYKYITMYYYVYKLSSSACERGLVSHITGFICQILIHSKIIVDTKVFVKMRHFNTLLLFVQIMSQTNMQNGSPILHFHILQRKLKTLCTNSDAHPHRTLNIVSSDYD